MLWLAKDERGHMLFHGARPHLIEERWMGPGSPVGRIPESELPDLPDTLDPSVNPVAVELRRSAK